MKIDLEGKGNYDNRDTTSLPAEERCQRGVNLRNGSFIQNYSIKPSSTSGLKRPGKSEITFEEIEWGIISHTLRRVEVYFKGHS